MKQSSYPVLKNRPIDQWKVTELKEELKRRKLVTRGLKEELIRRLDESLRSEMDSPNQDDEENESGDDSQPKGDDDSQPKGDDDAQPQGDDDSQPKGDDDSQLKGNDDTQTKGDDDAQPKGDDDSQPKGDDDSQLKGDDDSQPKGDDDSQPKGDDDSQPKGNDGETIPINEAPEVDTGADIVVNNEENQAHSHAEETIAITIESASEAPKVDSNDDLVVKGAEDKAGDVHGDPQPIVTSDEVTPIANESVTEALDLHEENQGGAKIPGADNVSGQAIDEKSVELSIAASEVMSSEAASTENKVTGNENSESRAQMMDAEDIKPSDEEVNQNTNELNNQVSEVSPSLGVKNDSNCTDSVSINEMNELKDNIIADDVKLECDVKHELVQPSSSPMDVEEPQNKVSVDETKISVKDEEISKKNSSADVGSPEKLNLDRSSCDDSMEEDTVENKQVDSTYISDEAGDEKNVVNMVKQVDSTPVDIISQDLSAAKKDSHVEDIAALTEKRKVPDDQEAVTNNEPSKRQRRWKTESVKGLSEQQSSSPTPKGVPQALGLTRSFSRSNSNADDDAPKDRVVPAPIKPPTDSLRIDNFVRPFTLKAVQEFLGKTGTVTSFWMDHIKTHCFVTYSCVEEATETRNAVYNLQWPPNGGRLLAAEFVESEEVKSRVEGPPQPPTPVGPTAQHQTPPVASPRQLGSRQKQMVMTNLPPPPPPRLQAPPPPPPPLPLPEMVEAPVVTLDDLFRKTKATPRIYYLPLSEEEVKAKVEALNRN